MGDSLRLNSGTQMPRIGFGTYQVTPGEATKQAVSGALEVGYRLIDTARLYDNEADVGVAIRESGIPRQELFVTTKLWNSDQGYDSALKAFDASLSRLGLEYVDLYLIHWPADFAFGRIKSNRERRRETWRAFVEIAKGGRAKSIGVSNFTENHLEDLLADLDTVPAVNQIEFHPFINEEQRPIVEFCKQHDIVIEAYSPLARGGKVNNPKVAAIAKKYSKSGAQILLRWAIQQNTVPLPRSTSREHIAENLDIFDFELSPEDMEDLNKLSDGTRVAPDPHKLK